MRIIPIIHCFDSNYVLPAAVCFQSLLEHANSANTHYAIHVIGELSESERDILRRITDKFKNASLNFSLPPPLSVSSDVLPASGHYSLDLFHKLSIPELYPEYNRAIVADVDVVYQDDIAKVFDAFPIDDEKLVAGVWDIGYAAYHRNGLFPIGRPLIRKYARLYTSKELNALKIGAGLLVYNMKALRDGGWTAKWRAFARENAYRAILPEQEVINLTLGDKIHILPLNFMAIAEHAIIYDGMSVAEKNKNLSWEEMYKAPIQMHYASKVKPWKYPGSSRSELWFEACVRAQMTSIWRKWYAEFSKSMVEKEFAKRIFELNMGRFNLNLIKKRKRSHV